MGLSCRSSIFAWNKFTDPKSVFMKPIQTALSSYGMSGQVFHGPLLQTHPGFRIVSVYERTRNRSEKKHPEARIARRYDDLLNDPQIELIIVNTPDHLHYEMALQALEKGKHVVIEKPMTLRLQEADQLIEKAHSKGLILSVFQNRRWDGDFLTVKEVIESHSLGRLVSFESHFDRFRNYIQDSWKEQDSLGTGTLYNLGSHMIDQALQLFGMPRSLYAVVRGLRTGSQVDDSFDLFLNYPDIKCFVRGSYLVKETGPRYILHGTRGSFIKYGLDPQEEALKSGITPGTKKWGEDNPDLYGILNAESDGGEKREVYPTRPGNYMDYYDNIYEAVRAGSSLEVKPEEARDVVKIIEAAYTSSSEDRVVSL